MSLDCKATVMERLEILSWDNTNVSTVSQQKCQFWKRYMRRHVMEHFEKQAKLTEKSPAHKEKERVWENKTNKKHLI